MSLVSVPLIKGKNNNKYKKNKSIYLKLCDINKYPLIKFQGKIIKEVFTELFKDVYILDKVYVEVCIRNYTKGKIYLNVKYMIYNGNVKPELSSTFIGRTHKYYFRTILSNSIIINGDNAKIFLNNNNDEVSDQEISNEKMLIEFFTGEYKYYSNQIDNIEDICKFEEYIKDRESYIMIIDAYLT